MKPTGLEDTVIGHRPTSKSGSGTKRGEPDVATGKTTQQEDLLRWAQSQFGLKLDSKERIAALQTRLAEHGHEVLPDGVLGPATYHALDTLRVEMQTDWEEGEADSGVDEAEAEEDKADTGEPATARPVALSDQAVDSLDDDLLDFGPSVRAVARFLLAKQTKAPLALAINAPWGRGKTSFMNMLDGELREARHSNVDVATTWFNPWKYSEAEQVWAAFVTNVVRCIEGKLGLWQRLWFHLQRWWNKVRRHADFGLVIRTLVAVSFLFLLATLYTLDWTTIAEAAFTGKQADPVLNAFYTAAKTGGEVSGRFGAIFLGLAWASALLLVLTFLYVSLTRKLGLNLLEYIEKTDFKDKIGTLSQFEGEMRRLSRAVPENLKIVVFIDDLDRCKGPVLGELVEALQLADVSRSCIVVLGMDLNIVANVIETERQELAHSVDTSATKLEHGSGYKFLEKIIQARLSLPTHSPEKLKELVTASMKEVKKEVPAQTDEKSAPLQKDAGIVAQAAVILSDLNPFKSEPMPQDSDEIIAAAEFYGSRHFRNPRRLKRFINGFRLQSYLAAERPEFNQIDRLARFLVLAEKWPALLDYVLKDEAHFNALQTRNFDVPGDSSDEVAANIQRLTSSDVEKVLELLNGQEQGDPFSYRDLKALTDWYGFCFYAGLQPK